MININNAKWELSKEEEYAIKWLEEHEFDGKLEKQHVTKTIFTVTKNGISDKFELTQGIPSLNIRDYMKHFEKNWEMYCKLQRMGV